MTGFANAEVDRVSQGGGALAVTLLSLATQATTTVTSCRECYINSANTSNAVRFSINSSTTPSLGAFLPAVGVVSDGQQGPGPMRVPIDDVGKLWFFGVENGVVGITYRT